jgi:hypothetical protein
VDVLVAAGANPAEWPGVVGCVAAGAVDLLVCAGVVGCVAAGAVDLLVCAGVVGGLICAAHTAGINAKRNSVTVGNRCFMRMATL